jgi:hypothetical protein
LIPCVVPGTPSARQTGVVTSALAGAGEVAGAAGLLRQRIDGAVGQQKWTVTAVGLADRPTRYIVLLAGAPA